MFYFEDAELFDEQLLCHGVSNTPHCFDSCLLLLYISYLSDLRVQETPIC